MKMLAGFERTLKVQWGVEEMPRDADGLRAALSRENRTFNLSMAVCALVGVLFIFFSADWKRESNESKEKQLIFEIGQSMPPVKLANGSSVGVLGAAPTESLQDQITDLISEREQGALLADLLRDLGIAVLIAVFVTIVIEVRTSNRLREHISSDVLSAAYEKVVPKEIFTQVADNIFRSNVCRRKWKAKIESAGQDPVTGTAVINATYSYEVENLNEHQIPFKVVASVSLDVPIANQSIPKFNSIAITDELDRSLVMADANETKTLLDTAPLQQKVPVVSKNLTLQRSTQEMGTQEMELIASVDIPAQQRIKVRYEVQRAIRVPGNYVLNAPTPADGIDIEIRVNGFKLLVVPLHPNSKALRHLPNSDTWEFKAGILPWQGFRFASEV